ncbi:hypothetical protein TSOC_013564 [Tetrabaena socialis]|uniref:Uncharacterized protein n=1 Tax=Tetrabaena socialis TaxID=47790 RepID=A0A2J7ZK04_9CHLO|nr:hypothetical protein TSOC_013564 [Tetrabaena socialis]|eukprot:PNH00606.1 hypothetical protein TSOC_013564 [Tetrabaena socialis]
MCLHACAFSHATICCSICAIGKQSRLGQGKHFTWRRCLALLIGGAVLYITSAWAPFRRLMRGIHAMPPRAGGGAGAVAGPGVAAAGAGVADGQAGVPAPGGGVGRRPLQRRGILHEILVFLVGFITSLLPAWNFNPEDAAAFAAAQAMLAEEERLRQQQQEAAAGAVGERAPVEVDRGASAREPSLARTARSGRKRLAPAAAASAAQFCM